MGNEKIESAGKPLSGVEVKIVDPDSGKEVKTGEVGEIIIKSPYSFKGYWHNQEATYKVPEVYFIDKLPKNQLGKVLKRELKDKIFN
jgi:acyl-CoA synthetase (AMP-forming)/AMP-acid ligase II